jgi:hypothetical protein
MRTKEPPSSDRFTELEVFPSLENAQIVRSRLESEGVSVTIPREQYASPEGIGVSIWVPGSQLKVAREIVDSLNRGEFDLDVGLRQNSQTGESLSDALDAQSERGDSDEPENVINGESQSGQTIVLGAIHLVLGVGSGFVLLGQQHWEIVAISGRHGGALIVAVALLAIWPYVVSWIICSKSTANALRIWIYIGVLAAVTAFIDGVFIEAFDSFGLLGVAAMTFAEAIIYIYAASVLRVRTSRDPI